MSVPELPAVGKIDPAFFDHVIKRRLGRADPSVLVGPENGVDCGVIDLGGGQVMALSTDPFFVVPAYGWERAAWFAVHIIASDVATSGLRPRYMSIDLNLPPDMHKDELAALWDATHTACDALGISVVTGHTGRYAGCNYPMLGGCTVMATGPADAYVSVGMSRSDDAVLMTKGAAIEAAGLMAATFPDRLQAAFGADFAERAQSIFWQMSTVTDALTAVQVGVRDAGITAMHDATECGVYGGLFEIARAANVGMRIDRARIPVQPDVARICELFEMDPYIAISEGTLLMTCRPHAVEAVIAALGTEGILAAQIGTCTPEAGVVRVDDAIIEHPGTDPFWAAFAREMGRAS